MAVDFITESTAQSILSDLQALKIYTDLWLAKDNMNTWEWLVYASRKGYADKILTIGQEIPSTYTLTDGTVYDYPWIVVDFQTVELQDGSTFNNIPILQAKYTNHEGVVFDVPELTVATEETAQEGYYYFGKNYNSTTYYSISLETGDTIPYENYTAAVYKTRWNNSSIAIRYGENYWARSNLRQYLNSTGTGWWVAQHDCDISPSQSSLNGFLSYIPSEIKNVITPIKKITKRSSDQSISYTNSAVDVTYDLFWIASISEINLDYNLDNGASWKYYRQLLNSNTPKSASDVYSYSALIRYSCDDTVTAQRWWMRDVSTANKGSTITTGGACYVNYPYYSYRVLPCTALV